MYVPVYVFGIVNTVFFFFFLLSLCFLHTVANKGIYNNREQTLTVMVNCRFIVANVCMTVRSDVRHRVFRSSAVGP